MMPKGKERIAHIFAQAEWHDDAYIFANTNALLEIKKAIEQALETGEGDCILMPSDGENFNLKIIKSDEEFNSPYWQKMWYPYTSEHAEYSNHNQIPLYVYGDYKAKTKEDLITCLELQKKYNPHKADIYKKYKRDLT